MEETYMLIEFTVPESHAEQMRAILAEAGAGQVGLYSHCTFSVKGTGRFKPLKGTCPFLGTEDVLETVNEEQITTYCHSHILTKVLAAIKQFHPYEETIIEVRPISKESFKEPVRQRDS